MSEERVRVAVDVVIFAIRDGALEVLLIQRKYPPFQGAWAIPGGFVLRGESLEDAARRELHEETGVADVYLEQFQAFGAPDRDPRYRVVSVAYLALIDPARATLLAGTDAAEARWWRLDRLPPLAFDHDHILDQAVARLRHQIQYTPISFQLLPPEFTLSELQRVYEAILGLSLDKRNFRRKIEALSIVRPLRRQAKSAVGRPAQLYRFTGRPSTPVRGVGSAN